MKKRRRWGGENGGCGDGEQKTMIQTAFSTLPSPTPRSPDCLNPSRGWDKMAAGRTSRPRSGLCVVINGNLKQRELTISFFISSPVLRAQESAHDERASPGQARAHHQRKLTRCTNTRINTYKLIRTRGYVLFVPRRVDLPEGGKRGRERSRVLRDPRGQGANIELRGQRGWLWWKHFCRDILEPRNREPASQPSSPRNIKRYVPRNSITIRRYSLAEEAAQMK